MDYGGEYTSLIVTLSAKSHKYRCDDVLDGFSLPVKADGTVPASTRAAHERGG
jgi:hypothetical protein